MDEGITDAQNFILKYFDAIQESAMHLYHSALPFWPTQSFLRQHHQNLLTEEVCVKLGLDDDNPQDTFRTIKTKSSKLSSVIFSKDGSLIATSGDHSIQIFDAATGACLATMVVFGFSPQAIAFSGDIIYLLSSWNDKGVRLWDVQTGDLVRTCFWHQSNVIDVAFSAKSNQFSSLDDCGHIYVQSTVSGTLDCTLKAKKGTIYCLWSSEDNILITYAPTVIHCFNILNQLCVQSFPEHQDSPSILTINCKGPLVVWMKKDVVMVHNLLTHEKVNVYKCNETLQRIQILGRDPESFGKPAPKYIVLSPDGDILILRVSKWLKVYHLNSISPKPVSEIECDKESDVIFAPDGRYLALASAQDGTVSLCHWHVHSPAYHVTDSLLRSHAAIRYICTSPDGKLITSGHQDRGVNLWSQKFGYKTFDNWFSYDGSVEALALSPDKKYIAICFANSNAPNISIQVQNVVHESEIQEFDLHQTNYFDPTFCALKFLDDKNLMYMVASARKRFVDFHFWTLKVSKFKKYKTASIDLHDTIERPWILEANNKAVVLHHSGNF